MTGSRRQFLTGMAAASAGAAFFGAGSMRAAARTVPNLVAGAGTAVVWPPASTPVWTLGGTYPSPTLRIESGERLLVRLRNELPEPTNIHWHGLAVPADMDGHPADVVAPGAARDYGFDVAERAGTYWYHPHPDGRTGKQVYSGMAGFLLVGDAEERDLRLPSGRHELPLLIQDRRLRPDRSLTYNPTMMDAASGMLGDVALVNGVADAALSVEASQYRLRLLNGCNARVLRIAFADRRPFLVIGTDGGLLERAVAANVIDLGPGERADLFVDFGREPPGAMLQLVSEGFRLPGMGMGMMGSAPQGLPLRLLMLRVTLPATAQFAVPGRLAMLERLDAALVRRARTFALTMGMGMGMSFGINGRAFDPGRVDQMVPLGELELWEVHNETAEPHSFHVHGTGFQVLDRSGAPALPPQDGGWKDTVLLWPGERVRLLVRFTRHGGVYVAHCHNLEHEDAGMMLNLEVA